MSILKTIARTQQTCGQYIRANGFVIGKLSATASTNRAINAEQNAKFENKVIKNYETV